MNKGADIFTQINNAIIDLQASQLQTFQRPLKKLYLLLHDPSLEPFNNSLKKGVDFDAFMAASERTGGSMVGSHHLVWPDNHEQTLGLTLLLIDQLAEDPNHAINFSHHYYYSGTKLISGIHSITRQLLIPFARDYKTYVLSHGNMKSSLIMNKSDNVFIVHGHDGEARESVARFVSNVGLTPIILHEQANQGRTIIEKVEACSDVGFAIILLTPDDLGRAKGDTELEPRARQNVLLELGYFIGRLGRENVCALKRGEVEIPSDFAGMVWAPMDNGNGWKHALGKELDAAGYNIDWNKVMRS